MALTRIVQVTDCHLQESPSQLHRGMSTEDRFDAVLSHLTGCERNIDLLWLTGDLAHHGYESSYRRLAAKVSGIAKNIIWLPGNHDDWLQMQSYPELCQPVWAPDLTPWAFISLNSIYEADGRGSGALGKEQRQWLMDQLAALQQDNRWVLIALHHPALDVGSQWQDQIKLSDADALLDIIKASSCVKGVLSGHLHQQHDLFVGGVPFWVTPATAPQYKARTREPTDELDKRLSLPGYRVFTLSDNGELTTDVVRVDV
ncbi:metallophosphoesterase family protein [Neptunomonas phycophila]|uniref:metallophosphoesterase family protein n=1 Tax=Neptunomonas phycophila TaxID=1572645 RepID=UPI00373676C6